ncbi:MAG: sugar phosphate isomerase/epimerase [Candidatus Sumerlaeia bacterium]|nr:sugar phosphate isomerase/epimerase [Candidatus Sumerlaeia bacterium]
MPNRRKWLSRVGAAAVGALAAGGAAQEDLRAKARKNLKLAIFTGVYAKLPVEKAARQIKNDGFVGVVCEYQFADVRFDPTKPDWTAADRIRKTLESQGLEICGLYGYYNVIHPDPAQRAAGEARMMVLLENWKRLGSPVVATETGTFNPKSQWLESPENETEEGYQKCRAAFENLARIAEKTGAIVAVEAYWRNVIASAERAERLFLDVNSPALKLVMDPCNYFRKEDLPQMKPMLEDIFRRVGRHAVLAHAKDVKESPTGTDTPAAGKGVLDYPLYLRLLAQLNRELFLALEHLTADDVPRARDYVLSQFEKI